jgi:ribonuclease-3 family protein
MEKSVEHNNLQDTQNETSNNDIELEKDKGNLAIDNKGSIEEVKGYIAEAKESIEVDNIESIEEENKGSIEEVKGSMEDNKGSIENNKEQLGLITFIQSQLGLPNIDVKTYSPLTLAFIGDVVYDLIIRTMVVEQGNAPVNKLHKKVSNLVKATAQVELLHKVEDMLTEEEISIFKRGRNAKSFTSAKNASITEYRIATGLEALIGYLYLDNQFARIVDIIQEGLKD